MKALLQKIEEKAALAKGYLEGDTKDVAKSQEIMAEVKELKAEFEIEKGLFETEKLLNTPDQKQIDDVNKDVEYNEELLYKALMKPQTLEASEKGVLLANTTDTAENGEQYIIPQDIDTTIRETKRQRLAARDLFNVETVTALAGRHTYDENNNGKLAPLVDGEAIAEADAPKFRGLPWTIKFYAALLPVSNILLGAEAGGLKGYLNRHFVKLSVATENEKVFDALKLANPTPKAVKGWEALKNSFNVDIDPALRNGSVFVTNQTGFGILDNEKDENGRPILQLNPANPTQRLFQGYPVVEFSDAELPNLAAGKAPIFYGNTKEYGTLLDYFQLTVAVSEHFKFNMNQSTMRVIQGFDTIVVDKEAAIYGALEATPAETEAGK